MNGNEMVEVAVKNGNEVETWVTTRLNTVHKYINQFRLPRG
jgi:hypothetical protein